MSKPAKLLKLEIVEKPRSTEGWKALRLAIPTGVLKEVAHRYGVTADHLRRWMREPLSDEAPLASGQRSPVDRACDLMDAVMLSNPVGVAHIREYIDSHHDQLLDALIPDEWNRREHAAELLRETVDVVNALNLDVCDEDTIAEVVEARNALDQLLKKLRGKGTNGISGVQAGAEGRTS